MLSSFDSSGMKMPARLPDASVRRLRVALDQRHLPAARAQAFAGGAAGQPGADHDGAALGPGGRGATRLAAGEVRALPIVRRRRSRLRGQRVALRRRRGRRTSSGVAGAAGVPARGQSRFPRRRAGRTASMRARRAGPAPRSSGAHSRSSVTPRVLLQRCGGSRAARRRRMAMHVQARRPLRVGAPCGDRPREAARRCPGANRRRRIALAAAPVRRRSIALHAARRKQAGSWSSTMPMPCM